MSLVSEGALDDFDKAKPSPAPPSTTTAPDASGPQKRSPGDTAKDALFASQEKFFQELFDSELASQATAEFEKAMKELAEEEPHLVEQFQKLSEAAGRVELWHVGRRADQGHGGARHGRGGWGREHPPHHAEYYAEPTLQGCAVPITEGDHRKVSRMVAESSGISTSRAV
uniref:Peroxisomal biosis factor 19 n=1 Tax=Nomascus leucogenys TaxID=61853 RepID=A0A2I3HT88_NOMLE